MLTISRSHTTKSVLKIHTPTDPLQVPISVSFACPDTIEKLACPSSKRSDMRFEQRIVSEVLRKLNQIVPNFDDRLNTVFWVFSVVGVIEHPSILEKKDEISTTFSFGNRSSPIGTPKRGRNTRQPAPKLLKARNSQTTSPIGFSHNCLKASISCAPSAPSMARWSKLPLAVITLATCSSPSTT